jgi:hypothetical protein
MCLFANDSCELIVARKAFVDQEGLCQFSTLMEIIKFHEGQNLPYLLSLGTT